LCTKEQEEKERKIETEKENESITKSEVKWKSMKCTEREKKMEVKIEKGGDHIRQETREKEI
jgi:hypothetical protein